MKRRIIAICGLCAIGSMFSGCFTAPVMPPIGMVYADTASTVDTDAQNNTIGLKRGVATTECVLGCVSWGDSSVHAAVQNGGINRIDHIDYEFKNIVGVYQKFTLVVYGE